MKYNDAIKQLQAKQLKSVYLITGEELYLAENYLKKITDFIKSTKRRRSCSIF